MSELLKLDESVWSLEWLESILNDREADLEFKRTETGVEYWHLDSLGEFDGPTHFATFYGPQAHIHAARFACGSDMTLGRLFDMLVKGEDWHFWKDLHWINLALVWSKEFMVKDLEFEDWDQSEYSASPSQPLGVHDGKGSVE